MITVRFKYGPKGTDTHTKEFNNEQEFGAWSQDEIGIYIISVERTGAAAFNRIFGGKHYVLAKPTNFGFEE